MSATTELYVLDDATVTREYVTALFGDLKVFLLKKSPGHCQRVDYLPRRVIDGLGRRLAEDAELQAEQIVCRVVTDKPSGSDLELWETTGSGAVALREDATYGRVKVFCALFPAGIRLAEEDSLNVATFKTDDAESFNISRCLDRHLFGKVNQLPQEEADILKAILNSTPLKSRSVLARLRYVLAVLGERNRSGRPVDWEVAGAYLYEAHIVPDFGLAEDTLTVQIERNKGCTDILSDGEKNLAQNLDRLVEKQGLQDEVRLRELAIYLATKNILRPEEWLPPICHDEELREKLSFECWRFAEPARGVNVELNPLQDPNKPEKVARGLVIKNGALTNDGKRPVQIRWKVSPSQPAELGGYRISVIRLTEDGEEIDVISPQSANARRKSFMVPMAENNLGEDEKCVARIRLQAVSRTGTPIPDAHDTSEDFWIENGEEFVAPPPERGTRIRHPDELAFRATHKSGNVYGVRSRNWDAKRDHVYSIRLTNNDKGELVLNPLLVEVERAHLLPDPGNLGILEVNAVNRRRVDIGAFAAVGLPPAVNTFANDFYLARSRFFGAIRALHDGMGVVEIADLHEHADDALAYVQAYLDMVKRLFDKVNAAAGPGGVNTVLHDYAPLMRIDTILMRVGPSESPMEVLLLAPTHPLRILWLYQFETFVRGWIGQMNGHAPDEIEKLISEDSIDKVVNLNVPNVVAWNQGRVFINTDGLDLYWSILPRADLPDLRTAVNAALQVLGATRREVVISTVTPKQIAEKVERYLCHHPYVQTLKINIINPGDGLLLLEATKKLLERPLYADLNFDLKFFAPRQTPHQLVGNAFDDLMQQRDEEEWSRGRTLSVAEEKLLQPNENPLFPKLIYAKHNIGELLEDRTGRFEAHLTFVIDYFGTTMSTREHAGATTSSSLHNLLAEYITDYSAGETTATWSRMIAPSRCADLASDGNTGRLFECQETLAHLTACFYDWGKSLEKYATVQLELTDEPGKDHIRMLRRVHLLSDWVFTVDRNFGIEFYDDPAKGPTASESGGYLIDYTPEFLDAVAHRMIISTYHQQEIESILRVGFAGLLAGESGEEASIDSYTVGRVLQVLKSVSGKLALKLINNPSQAQEVIGLALTRLALEKEGRLAGRVLIPVDSHIPLFYQTRRELENSELTLKRTDLLLVELRGREARVDLIEVKNRKHTSSQEMVELQLAIRDKNLNTEAHFRANFLGAEGVKRFDADIKNKELANVLAFYLERACRYGLFMPADADLAEQVSGDPRAEFLKGLEAIAAGACEVSFRHQGFIINGSAATDIDERVVHNNDIYVIGRAGIRRLLDIVLPPEDETLDTGEPGGGGGAPPSPGEPPTEIAPLPDQQEAPPPAPSPVGPGAAEQLDVEDKGTAEAEARLREELVPGAEGAMAEPAQAIRVHLGQHVVTGNPVFWDPYTSEPRRLTNQHILVVGKSGAGKSETTKALVWELGQLGVPTIILDYQGEYARGDFFEAVHPQVFNVMDGLPINPFELPIDPATRRKRSPIEMVFRLADTLNTVFSGSGDIQLGVLREAIEECYSQKGFNQHDPSTWENEPPTLDMLKAVLDYWAEDRGAQVRNLQVRLQPLFKGGIFQQGRTSFTFDDLFARTSVILMTAGIKDLMLAASRFVLEKVYAAMLMAGMSRALRVVVCIDEAHKLCGDETITSLIKEARKYGLGLLLSSQETRDFHQSVFANAGTIICLALEDIDATEMSKHLGLTDSASKNAAKELILNQPNGQALIRSQHFRPYEQIRILSFEDRARGKE